MHAFQFNSIRFNQSFGLHHQIKSNQIKSNQEQQEDAITNNQSNKQDNIRMSNKNNSNNKRWFVEYYNRSRK
jgi:hypothetical protein